MLKRAVILIAFALSAGALACCVASNGTPVNLSNENVIVIWDSKRGIEHFIRQADFETTAKDFGFIVPTPSVPQLSVADPKAFSTLAHLVPPPSHFGCSKSDDTASAGGVEVLRTERVGDYQATVVRATDGQAMNAWLNRNGYVSRPAMTEWLDYYAKQQWIFTAFKFVATDPTRTTTKAVRLSFKTPRPRYPYKMPKDTWPAGYQRPMNLYFISESQMDSKYVDSDGSWEAKKLWSGSLPNSSRDSVAANVGLKRSDFPSDATVTIFENGQNPDGYVHDLYFAATVDWMTPTSYGALTVVLVLAVLAIRRRRGLRPPSV